MDAFLTSTISVALAEMGDKTQLLAILLTARLRQPMAIIAGIFAATIINHLIAGAAGNWLNNVAGPDAMRWVIGIAFLIAAVWALVPDKAVAREKPFSRGSAFTTALVAFFLAENGDKTQLATVVLAAQYSQYLVVVAGTTLGMMVANIPAVLLGERILHLIPMKILRWGAALLFAALGIASLLRA